MVTRNVLVPFSLSIGNYFEKYLVDIFGSKAVAFNVFFSHDPKL